MKLKLADKHISHTTPRATSDLSHTHTMDRGLPRRPIVNNRPTMQKPIHDADETSSLTKEELETLREFISVIPDVMELLTKAKESESEDGDNTDNEGDKSDDKVLLENDKTGSKGDEDEEESDKGSEEDDESEEDEEEEEDVIGDSIHDSAVSSPKRTYTEETDSEIAVDKSFQDYYNNQLKK